MSSDRSQHAKELLAGLSDSETLLRLWSDGEQAVRGYQFPPCAMQVRVEQLTLRQQVAYYCHLMVENAHKTEDG